MRIDSKTKLAIVLISRLLMMFMYLISLLCKTLCIHLVLGIFISPQMIPLSFYTVSILMIIVSISYILRYVYNQSEELILGIFEINEVIVFGNKVNVITVNKSHITTRLSILSTIVADVDNIIAYTYNIIAVGSNVLTGFMRKFFYVIKELKK